MMFGGKQVVVCGYGEVGTVTTVYTSNTALSISLSLVCQSDCQSDCQSAVFPLA